MTSKPTTGETTRTPDGTELVRLATSGANWKTTLANIFTSLARPIYATSTITFHCSSTGNDTTGNGSSGSPFASIQHAYDVAKNLYNFAGFDFYIQLDGPGSYGPLLIDTCLVGCKNFVIIGDNANHLAYTMGRIANFNATPQNVWVSGLTLSTSGHHVDWDQNAGVVYLGEPTGTITTNLSFKPTAGANAASVMTAGVQNNLSGSAGTIDFSLGGQSYVSFYACFIDSGFFNFPLYNFTFIGTMTFSKGFFNIGAPCVIECDGGLIAGAAGLSGGRKVWAQAGGFVMTDDLASLPGTGIMTIDGGRVVEYGLGNVYTGSGTVSGTISGTAYNVRTPALNVGIAGSITGVLGLIGPSSTITVTPYASGVAVGGSLRTDQKTVATLPAAGNAGARSFVTDATTPTWGATVVGGGAVKTPVYDDGAAWKVG